MQLQYVVLAAEGGGARAPDTPDAPHAPNAAELLQQPHGTVRKTHQKARTPGYDLEQTRQRSNFSKCEIGPRRLSLIKGSNAIALLTRCFLVNPDGAFHISPTSSCT